MFTQLNTDALFYFHNMIVWLDFQTKNKPGHLQANADIYYVIMSHKTQPFAGTLCCVFIRQW